jgi:nucleoside ABC transporter membrane protein
MFNWIGLYLVNELIYQNGTGPMYDVRNTRTLNLGKSADCPSPSSRTSA